MSSDQNPPRATRQQRPAQAQAQRDADQDTEMLPAPLAQQQHRPSAPSRSQPPSTTPTTATGFSDPAAPHTQQPQQQEVEQEENQEPDQDKDKDRNKQPPPPPPPAPGPRAARLQALFASTARHTLDKISRDNFAACFPTVAAKAPGTLEFVQRQMVERLGGLWNREFETIMANRQVVARLNELESLVGDATRRRLEAGEGAPPPVAPHTLPAQTILSAHLRPHLTSQHAQLSTALRDTQAANAALWAEVCTQRAETEALLAGVEKVLRDVDGANALLGEVAEELAEETRAAEAEVRAVAVGVDVDAGGSRGTGSGHPLPG